MASVRKKKRIYKGKVRWDWIVDYFDAAGERRQETFKRSKDANARLDVIKQELRAGVHTADSASMTVSEAGQVWIKACEAEGLERSTTHQYKNHLKYHINPILGQEKLSRLTKPKVQAFADQMLADGKSKALTRKVVTSLGSLIAEAEKRGLVAQNVARGLRLRNLKRRKEPVTIPTLDEIQALINTASERWRPYILTAIFTGLRSSELRALRWADVDFDAKVIRVRRRADRWNEIGNPKSATSRRDVPMSAMVRNTLGTWQKECPRKGKTKENQGTLDLVFPNGSGNIENHANIYRRGFVPLQIACGAYTELPAEKEGDEPVKKVKYGLHDLRHAAASLFIQYAGYQPKRVQEVMGHASITMTFDIYGHLFPSPDDDQKAMSRIEEKLFGCGEIAATS
ncbi:MAG: tyrosine-type recombinase/integrase [Alphaproteobacteria bacterium]|nr:tyrosine-type recombinase/integrase [Alphaproteobacteria bacterium]